MDKVKPVSTSHHPPPHTLGNDRIECSPCNQATLTQWRRNKMATGSQTTFSDMTCFKFVPKCQINNETDNGLAPNRRHAIDWTNTDAIFLRIFSNAGLVQWRMYTSPGLNELKVWRIQQSLGITCYSDRHEKPNWLIVICMLSLETETNFRQQLIQLSYREYHIEYMPIIYLKRWHIYIYIYIYICIYIYVCVCHLFKYVIGMYSIWYSL